MNKAGNALGYFLSGWVLALTGFSADKAVQDPGTIFWIRACGGIQSAVVPRRVFHVAYPFTQEKMAEIRAQWRPSRQVEFTHLPSTHHGPPLSADRAPKN